MYNYSNMTPQDFIAKLRADADIIRRAAPSMSQEIAESTLTLIKDRSINEGILIDGREGNKAQYSTRRINTQKFKGKERNRAGSAYIAANMLGTWHEFRKAQGLNSEPVNLSYNNDMWENIQILQTRDNGDGKANTIVGSYDEETNKKILGNTALFGDFLTPTEDELKIAQEVLQEKILKLLRQ